MGLTARDKHKLLAFLQGDELCLSGVNQRLSTWLQDWDVNQSGNKVYFSESEKRRIHDELIREGKNIAVPLNSTRVEASHFDADDKLADIKPDENRILAASHRPISLQQQPVFIPPGASLRLNFEALQLNERQPVVVVENLDIFDSFAQLNVPASLSGALWLYRGHDKSISKGVKRFIQQLGAEHPLYWFPDFDPQGLAIALQEPKVSGMLLPELSVLADMSCSYYNNSAKYQQQQDAIIYLKRQGLSRFPDLIQLILDKKSAIVQQHFVSRSTTLVLHLSQ